MPVVREGAPPAVDVYIDDGRHGEYQHQPVHWNNQSVWNRRFADSGTLHEDPWLNRTNFAYVRVRNRGTQTANDVVVRAFHTDPGAGPLARRPPIQRPTPSRRAASTVGPFSWTPTTPDHECLLMIASATGTQATSTRSARASRSAAASAGSPSQASGQASSTASSWSRAGALSGCAMGRPIDRSPPFPQAHVGGRFAQAPSSLRS